MNDIKRFLEEDLKKKGDITSNALFENENCSARILSKEDCIISGLEEINRIFKNENINTFLFFTDGKFIKKGSKILELEGSAKSILKVERLCLNILGRMSGITTETKTLVNICKKINPEVEILATRKTTPGFRKFEKKAVVVGGGKTHRHGLFDAVLIKDNHLKVVGSLEKAIDKIKKNIKDNPIEIEVENKKDAIVAAKLGVDIIMLDNFCPDDAKRTFKQIKNINPNILIEISGGINKDNIDDYASFADRISIGYITHSVKCIDFSLEII